MEKLKSGEFLVKSTNSSDIFIPEEYTEEQLMIAHMIQDFLDAEVNPIVAKLDEGNRDLMAATIRKAGELGLMGIAIPEEYGGFEQDFVTQMLAAENIGAGYSFSVAFMASTGIGTLPIMYYGNEEQRQKYVTKLASGEFIGAYCLTEPDAGSDANSGKTQAILSEDGKHYILNGQKMWITNAGFADTHVVFAKIANDRVLSAFIVEKTMPGVEIGPDEKKMGIKGSSTCQIYYNDVKVPVENLIGRGGMGFRIALNILHMGRIKLGANVIGAAKKSISDAVKYANERKQFNVLISTFPTIKHKIAEQAIRTFALESAIYRASHDIDCLMKKYKAEGMDKGLAAIEAIAHYAVEAALLKVYGSEVLDFVVDETVQIHGGMGYSAEMDADRGYRDSRINRIFEGTNEINRLLLVETAIKRGMKGDFDMAGPAKEFYENMENCRINKKGKENFFEQKLRYIENFKRAALILIHKVSDKYEKDMLKEQEIINNISDMMIQIYTAESLTLRVKKIAETNAKPNLDLYKDIVNVLVYEAAAVIFKNAKDAVFSMTEGEESEKMYKALKDLSCVEGVNTKDARRRIADFLIDKGEYKL